MELRYGDAIADRLLLDGTFEPHVSAVAFALIRPGMTVVDVGANIGVHTLHFSRLVGPTGRVFAIEPNPAAVAELRRNLTINNVDNVTVAPVALWDREGEGSFFFPVRGQEAMGSLARNKRFRVAYEAKVATGTLDSLLARNGVSRVDFIKLDVEGAELPVLRGATGLLGAGVAPAILYESSPANCAAFSYGPDDVRQFLSAWGYSIERIDHEDYLAIPTDLGDEAPRAEAQRSEGAFE